ncbi:MAG: hypothetical protein F4X57_12870 [Chloroflexi bacterium]|nr:hypothetical protein [Chloroflexota bacterium]
MRPQARHSNPHQPLLRLPRLRQAQLPSNRRRPRRLPQHRQVCRPPPLPLTRRRPNPRRWWL